MKTFLQHKIAKGYTIILAEYHFDFFSNLRFTAGPEDDSASDDNFLDESDDPDIQNNRWSVLLSILGRVPNILFLPIFGYYFLIQLFCFVFCEFWL